MAGNPPDYIIIQGGVSEEFIDPESAVAGFYKLKTTLTDFWTFDIKDAYWQQVYPNSVENPENMELAAMTDFEADRLLILYGGQYGETLYDDMWVYNLNNNLWQRSKIADAGHLYEGFFYNCS